MTAKPAAKAKRAHDGPSQLGSGGAAVGAVMVEGGEDGGRRAVGSGQWD